MKRSLTHNVWECKLCAAEHNLHYVQQNFMLSETETSLLFWATNARRNSLQIKSVSNSLDFA